MVNGRRSCDCRRLGRGGAWPGVGEDGGGGGKLLCTMNQSRATVGRRSMGGGGDGTSSARLGGGRRERELSEINKNWEMVRGLKDSTGLIGHSDRSDRSSSN